MVERLMDFRTGEYFTKFLDKYRGKVFTKCQGWGKIYFVSHIDLGKSFQKSSGKRYNKICKIFTPGFLSAIYGQVITLVF